MEFCILGPVEVLDGAQAVQLGGPQRRLVLALLLTHAGDTVPSATMVDALWGDSPPSGATAVLHTQISRLRKALEPDQAAGSRQQLLASADGGYRLEPGTNGIDARRFEDLVDAGRKRLAASDPEGAGERLAEALGLWRGPAYGDLGGHPSLLAAAAELEERRLTAAEELAEARLQLGEHSALVAELETTVRAHPYRERSWSQLMLALYRCGRQADALAAYQRCRRLLADELGIEPGPELQALEQAVLLQKGELAWQTGPTPHERMTVLQVPTADASAVSQAVEASGGVVADGGDVVLGLFESPLDALRTAAAVRRKASGGVAVHTGQAVRIGADWFGPAVSQAARLASLAHAGQVVVSDPTAELVRDLLPGELELRSLGMHRFLGRTEIERVHELAGGDFPPLRTGAELIGLPVETSSFVGRGTELARIADRIRQHRLVTLTGPGGTGKTRLALRAARGAVDSCPDGVVFVDLAPVDDADRLPAVLARALRLPDDREAVLDGVTDFLRDRRMLLMLDNCEQLVGAAADLAATVLRRCPEVRVLATSREHLATPGEAIWRVRALTLPAGDGLDEIRGAEAVRLFEDRARSVSPGFELDASNAPTVAGICRRLDGLPLAIELAAARLRMLSPAQIADRLDDRFSLLTGSARTAPARQQTLQAVVEWSYQQLEPEARGLFARLSVFPASFSLDAAEAVGGPRCLDLLTELIDKSLVQVIEGGESRYRLLETLRAYAAGRLRTDLAAHREARAAHAAYFCSVAEQASVELRGPDDLDWSRRLDADYENVREALRWAAGHDAGMLLRMTGALGDYWFGHGPYRDAETFTAEALRQNPVDAPGRAAALCTAVWMALVRTDLDAMSALAGEAVTVASAHGEHRAHGDALFQLAYAADAREEYGEALRLSEDLSRLDGVHLWHRAEALSHVARLGLERDEHERARAVLPDALAAARAAGDRLSSILVHREAGRLAALDEDTERELGHHREALRLAAEAGHGRQVVWCLRYLRRAMLGRGDLAAARGYAANAAAIATDLGGSQQIAATRLYLAELDRLQGNTTAARERLDTVLDSAAYTNPALLLRGEIEWLDGNLAAARTAYRAAAREGHDAGRACAEIGLAVVTSASPAEVGAAARRLVPPARHDVRAWYLALVARALAASEAPAERVRAALRSALTQAGRANDLPALVRTAEQIGYLGGGPAAQLLAATTAVRDRIGMPRTSVESQWYAACGAPPASPAATDLLELAGAVLRAPV